MTEERTQYTVHPDVAIRLDVAERHIEHLASTIDGMTMVMGRHADTITEQEQTIARLEQEVKGYKLSAAAMEGAYVTSDDEATKLKATVQRLEQDNRRLRHLDAMPVGAIVSAMEWCDKTGADESIVNDIADFLATLDGAA